MASRRMLPDTVTIFNYIGEVDDVAKYQATQIKYCYCPMVDGVMADKKGKKTKDSITLYIFDSTSKCMDMDGAIRQFLPCHLWRLLSTEDKAQYWTIGDNGKDYVIKNGHTEKLYFQSYSHHVNGSRKMWHFEVSLK